MTLVINSPTFLNSFNPNPRVVAAWVPSLIPDVIIGFSVSNGIPFLLHVVNKKDIVSPGHVFPIIARDGGVLVRAGHTEASVDVSKLSKTIYEAFEIARSGRPGPVLIDVPKDVQFAKARWG